MLHKLALGFASLALAVASAAPKYNVTFFERTVINGSELKPGDYKVEVNGDRATITQGKVKAETGVKVETAGEKFRTTAVRYGQDSRVEEIRVGGTKTRLIFEAGKGEGAGTN